MTPRDTLLKYLEAATKERRSTLMEDAAADVCRGYGIPTPQAQFRRTGQAADAAAKVGFPLVMKIVSPQISHKSDVGGVRLNIRSAEEARQAGEGILSSVKSHAPGAKIRGFWMAQMAGKGVETIVGLKRDAVFGRWSCSASAACSSDFHKDVSFSVCPWARATWRI